MSMFISGPSPCSGGVQAESWGYCSSIYVHRVLASDLQHDVTDAEATKSVVRKAVKQFGRLDVAFAKAGISWRSAPATLRNYDEDEFERICAADLNPQPTSVCRDGQQPARSGRLRRFNIEAWRHLRNRGRLTGLPCQRKIGLLAGKGVERDPRSGQVPSRGTNAFKYNGP